MEMDLLLSEMQPKEWSLKGCRILLACKNLVSIWNSCLKAGRCNVAGLTGWLGSVSEGTFKDVG
jgi:hypothetical protein